METVPHSQFSVYGETVSPVPRSVVGPAQFNMAMVDQLFALHLARRSASRPPPSLTSSIDVLASNNGQSKNEACCCAHLHAIYCTVCATCRSPICCTVHTGACHQTTRCCSPLIPHGEQLKSLLQNRTIQQIYGTNPCSLNPDAILSICSYLSLIELCCTCRVNHHWYHHVQVGRSIGLKVDIDYFGGITIYKDVTELTRFMSGHGSWTLFPSTLAHHIQQLGENIEEQDEPTLTRVKVSELNIILQSFTCLTSINVSIQQGPKSLDTIIEFHSSHFNSLTSIALDLGTSSAMYIGDTLKSISQLISLNTLWLNARGPSFEPYPIRRIWFSFSPLMKLPLLHTLTYLFHDSSPSFSSDSPACQTIRELKHLTSLNLNEGRLSAEQVRELRLPNLTHFNQKESILKTKKQCDELYASMPGLKSLKVFPVTKTSLSLMPLFQQLESIHLRFDAPPLIGMPKELITDQTLIEAIAQCPHLTEITFDSSILQSPQSWLPIFDSLPQLTSLVFLDTPPLLSSYDDTLTTIALVCPQIQTLHLQNCLCFGSSLSILSTLTACRDLALFDAFDPNEVSFQELVRFFDDPTMLPLLTHLFISCESNDGVSQASWDSQQNLKLSGHRLFKVYPSDTKSQDEDSISESNFEAIRTNQNTPPIQITAPSTDIVSSNFGICVCSTCGEQYFGVHQCPLAPVPSPLCCRCDSIQLIRVVTTSRLRDVPWVEWCVRCTNNDHPNWLLYERCISHDDCGCESDLFNLQSLVSDPSWNIWSQRCYKGDITAKILIHHQKRACSEMRSERALVEHRYPNRRAVDFLRRAGLIRWIHPRPCWAVLPSDLLNLVTDYLTIHELAPMVSIGRNWYNFFQKKLKKVTSIHKGVVESNRLSIPLQSESTIHLELNDGTHLVTSPLSSRLHRVHLHLDYDDETVEVDPWLIDSRLRWFKKGISHVKILTITFELEWLFTLDHLCPPLLHELNLIIEYDAISKQPVTRDNGDGTTWIVDEFAWFRDRIADLKNLNQLRVFSLCMIESIDPNGFGVNAKEEVAIPMMLLEQICVTFPALTDLSINLQVDIPDQRFFDLLRRMTQLKRLSIGRHFQWNHAEVIQWLTAEPNPLGQLEFIDLSLCNLNHIHLSLSRLSLKELLPNQFSLPDPRPLFHPLASTLTALKLQCTNVVGVNELVESVRSCDLITRLHLSHRELTSPNLVTILSGMAHLQVLHLSGCSLLGDLGFLTQVAHLSETLNCLSLCSSGILVNELDRIFSLTHLHYLILFHTLVVGDELNEDMRQRLLPGARNSGNDTLLLPNLIETRIDDPVYQELFLQFVFTTAHTSLKQFPHLD